MGGGSQRMSGMSDETAKLIDSEIKDFVTRNYDRAEQILKDNMDVLHSMKDALMKYETIDAPQIDDLMARVEVRPPRDAHDIKPKAKASKSDDDANDTEKKPTSESQSSSELDDSPE